jgi:hypothetical protein
VFKVATKASNTSRDSAISLEQRRSGRNRWLNQQEERTVQDAQMANLPGHVDPSDAQRDDATASRE